MECKEPVQVRFTYNRSQGIIKLQIKFSGCTGVHVGWRGHGRSQLSQKFSVWGL